MNSFEKAMDLLREVYNITFLHVYLVEFFRTCHLPDSIHKLSTLYFTHISLFNFYYKCDR